MKLNDTLRKLSNKYKSFFYGRYGHDGLNRFLCVLALALCVLSFVVKSYALTVSILVLLALTIIRSTSKKFDARRRENQLYEKMAAPVKHISKYWFIRIKCRKTHRVYACEKCRSILRVPIAAGRGKIEIKCPKCSAISIRR